MAGGRKVSAVCARGIRRCGGQRRSCYCALVCVAVLPARKVSSTAVRGVREQDIYEKHVYVPTVGQAACVSVHDGNTDVCSGTT